jgi:hypothetical protein
MTPVEICAAVLAGIVPSANLPEQGDENTRQEVRYRLSQVGCDLVYLRHFESWTARFVRRAPDIGAVDSPDLLPDLMTATGMSRPWIYLRLRDLAEQGHVIQVSRGRWRAVTDDTE